MPESSKPAPPQGVSPDRAADAHEIAQLVYRYARYADEKDLESWLGLFGDDASFTYQNGTSVVRGVQALADFFEAGRRWSAAGPSTHLMGGAVVDFDPADAGRAAVRTAGVAYLSSPTGAVVTRGLHYRDVVVRTGAGWRFAERDHRVDWEYRVAAERPTVVGDTWQSAAP